MYGWGHEIHVVRGYTPGMSTGVSVDEFQALEQKVLRAVDIVKREREARAAAEAEVSAMRERVAALQSELEAAQGRAQAAESAKEAAHSEKESAESQIGALNHEREVVRQRVERLLQQMDEL
jgi:hypothetical protein